LFLILPILVFSQNEEVSKDSISSLNPYIEDHSNQLNVKLDISNNQLNYNFPYDGVTASLKTNLNISYGFIFSYKYFSVRLGVRPKLSDTEIKNKGKTDVFRVGFKMLFDKWSHALEYNYRRGYYVDNTNDIPSLENNEDFYVQFPNLTTNTFSGVSQYKFNVNYSVRAVESNTEIQLKSAGTFMPGITYSFYSVKGTDKVKVDPNDIITRDSYNDYKGITLIFEPGYYYTFVLHKYWYANVYGAPGLGFDFYNATYNSPNNSSGENLSRTFFSLKTGAAIGYNGKKFYFGSEFKYQIFSENFDENDISLQPTKSKFHVFVGYRFKAPKQVSKPLDYIEDKVPILKKGDNN
tara:strand:- start:30067 stop:31119 length:1053 start_codon:yes stop_codon:yes gene_type:complete